MTYFDDDFLSRKTDDTAALLNALMRESNKGVSSFVNKYLSAFDIKNGVFVNNGRNKRLLLGLQKEVEKILQEDGYLTELGFFKDNFETISTEIVAAHLAVNSIKVVGLKSFEDYAVARVLDALSPRNLAAAIHSAIRQTLFDSVYLGRSLLDAYKATEAVLSPAEKGTMLETWAHTATRDAYYQYDGLVNGAIADKHKLDAFLYTGSIVAESRPQCKRWVNEVKNGQRGLLLVSDLKQEVEWAFKYGAGMIPSTNALNFTMYRGGYNCRHRVFPTRSKK